jgi:hypothetical protein
MHRSYPEHRRLPANAHRQSAAWSARLQRELHYLDGAA